MYHSRWSVKHLNMKMISLILQLIVASTAFGSGAKLGGKGNMRGVRTRFSGLSPRQVAVLKLMMNRKRYGRFAWKIEHYIKPVQSLHHPDSSRLDGPFDRLVRWSLFCSQDKLVWNFNKLKYDKKHTCNSNIKPLYHAVANHAVKLAITR